jgi:hypothetical protein
MQVKIFIVPAIDESKELEEMNRFLLSRKILDIDKYLVIKNMFTIFVCSF